jgi:thioredoxin-like negative regulator of GroEL
MAKNNYMFNLILPSSLLLLIAAIIVMIHSGYLREGFQQKYSLEYFYMDGCGHCVDFNKSGVWDKVENTKWNNVKVEKFNMKDARQRVEKFNIKGFPSIVMIDSSSGDEKVVESFNDERTFPKIAEFISKFTQ